jgi:hypothetical protein
MKYALRLTVEALCVGLGTVAVAYLLMAAVQNTYLWQKANSIKYLLLMFATGVCVHLLCEVTGLNTWYTQNGAAVDDCAVK